MNEFPIDIPEPNYIDMKTGYSLSIPLGKQGVFSYDQFTPEVLAMFMQKRKRLGIELIDFPETKP